MKSALASEAGRSTANIDRPSIFGIAGRFGPRPDGVVLERAGGRLRMAARVRIAGAVKARLPATQ